MYTHTHTHLKGAYISKREIRELRALLRASPIGKAYHFFMKSTDSTRINQTHFLKFSNAGEMYLNSMKVEN